MLVILIWWLLSFVVYAATSQWCWSLNSWTGCRIDHWTQLTLIWTSDNANVAQGIKWITNNSWKPIFIPTKTSNFNSFITNHKSDINPGWAGIDWIDICDSVNWVWWTASWWRFLSEPSWSSLCSTWTASNVTWAWPWSWTCQWSCWWVTTACSAIVWWWNDSFTKLLLHFDWDYIDSSSWAHIFINPWCWYGLQMIASTITWFWQMDNMNSHCMSAIPKFNLWTQDFIIEWFMTEPNLYWTSFPYIFQLFDNDSDTIPVLKLAWIEWSSCNAWNKCWIHLYIDNTLVYNEFEGSAEKDTLWWQDNVLRHLALVRSWNNLYMYIGWIKKMTYSLIAWYDFWNNFTGSTAKIQFWPGGNNTTYIDEFRISVWTDRWWTWSNITVPSVPYN